MGKNSVLKYLLGEREGVFGGEIQRVAQWNNSWDIDH